MNSRRILLGNAQIRVGFQSLVWSAPSGRPHPHLAHFFSPVEFLSLDQSKDNACG